MRLNRSLLSLYNLLEIKHGLLIETQMEIRKTALQSCLRDLHMWGISFFGTLKKLDSFGISNNSLLPLLKCLVRISYSNKPHAVSWIECCILGKIIQCQLKFLLHQILLTSRKVSIWIAWAFSDAFS
jgi:hypothetical protein